MRICGIELTGSSATVVVLDGTQDDFEVMDTGITKINIKNPDSADDVRNFKDVFQAFIANHHIERIGIKKRGTKGKFAGGSVSFKMEGIIQLTDCDDVVLIPAQTISAKLRNATLPPCDSLFGYQETAYETAYTLLIEMCRQTEESE